MHQKWGRMVRGMGGQHTKMFLSIFLYFPDFPSCEGLSNIAPVCITGDLTKIQILIQLAGPSCQHGLTYSFLTSSQVMLILLFCKPRCSVMDYKKTSPSDIKCLCSKLASNAKAYQKKKINKISRFHLDFK